MTTNPIIIACRWEILDFVIKYLDNNVYEPYKLALNLEGATAEQINDLLSAFYRKWSGERITVNKDSEFITVWLSASQREYNMQFLVKNAYVCFNDGTLSGTALDVDVYNIDRIDPVEKNKFLKSCLASIPKRRGNKRDRSAMIFRKIVQTICKDEEKTNILKGFEEWLNS